MKTIKVKAIFRGQDGSCGYETNTEYRLIISYENKYIHIEAEAGNRGWCDYNSILAFLNNWDNIRRI